jgi:hypothetical protein
MGGEVSDTMGYAHELRPGDEYEPLAFSIPADFNQQFLYAIADFDPIYLGVTGAPAQIHPMILLHMSARTRSTSFRLAPNMGSVFARENVRFCRPAYVDEPLVATWKIRDVYQKNGRLYQSMIIKITGPDGEIVIDREMYSVFFADGGAPADARGKGP